METKALYYENPGVGNTEEVLNIVRQRAEELGIKTILVASTTGATAVKAIEALKGFRVIVVTHATGFKEPNAQEFLEENRKIVQSKGVPMLTATHAFGGINRAMRQMSFAEAPTTYVIGDIIASTLRTFGQGTKVACEIAVMAADGGLVRTDEDIITIAGTGSGTGGRGADTALVVQPAGAEQYFKFQVKEIICKPRNPHRY